MKRNDLCPNCFNLITFEEPADFFECEEGDAIEGIICPHCKTKLVIYYNIEPSFYVREATKEELEELDF